jgi:hypothetical protein
MVQSGRRRAAAAADTVTVPAAGYGWEATSSPSQLPPERQKEAAGGMEQQSEKREAQPAMSET